MTFLITDEAARKLVENVQKRRKLDAVGSKGGSPNVDFDFAVDVLSRKLVEVLDRQRWIPIETAPKDGREILLARVGQNEVGKDLGIWWCCSGFWSDKWTDGIDSLANPTHWMPLPQPPEQKT